MSAARKRSTEVHEVGTGFMWPAVAILLIVWGVLKFAMGKGGFVHILLVTAISVAIVQFLTDRKTRYHNKSLDR